METHLKKIYQQAYSEVSDKWDTYMHNGQERLENLYSAYLGAPADQKAATLARYQDALQSYTLRNRWYHDMVAETAYRLAHVNEIAMAYVNGRLPEIYLANFNHINAEVADIGIKWTIRDENMIRNLAIDSLYGRQVNYAKDIVWNTRQINSSVLQGVIQGESIPKMAQRLLPVVNNNKTAAIRTARTMVTGAENRGRLDRYAEYEEQGIIMRKVWIATPDGRTRNWHMSMDGQEVDTNEPFIDGLGNELEYPGDPSAPANTVYNCRCSMRSHLIGIKGRDGKVEKFTDYRAQAGETMHEWQIREEKERRNGF